MTSTGRSSWPGKARTCAPSAPIVRGLLRDRDVVRVRLAQPRRRDPDEAGALHLVDRRRAAIAHRLAQAADQLADARAQQTLVAAPPLDSLRDQLLRLFDVPLEVPVLRRTAAHRAEQCHA